jgi:HAD superfamily hydrolase (TIGR01509 family)
MGKPADKMWEEIKELKGVAASLEVLNERHRMVAEKYFSEIEDIKPVDGLVDVLEELKVRGLLMAVASSSLRSVIDIILKKTGLEKYFDVIVSREDVKEGKPSPDIFLHAASLLNAGPEKCIVIEDSSNGIKAAKAAGMFCVAFTGTGDGNTDTSLADVEISSIGELTNYFKK